MNTVALIAFYYASSIGLTFYQSWLMKELKFPLTIVLCHFVMKFVLSAACRAAYTLHTGLERVTLG
jgi:solute carrier family 35 protein C2